MQATLSKEQLNELGELICDSVQFICDQEMISGELAWTVVECLATAKIAQLQGRIN